MPTKFHITTRSPSLAFPTSRPRTAPAITLIVTPCASSTSATSLVRRRLLPCPALRLSRLRLRSRDRIPRHTSPAFNPPLTRLRLAQMLMFVMPVSVLQIRLPQLITTRLPFFLTILALLRLAAHILHAASRNVVSIPPQLPTMVTARSLFPQSQPASHDNQHHTTRHPMA